MSSLRGHLLVAVPYHPDRNLAETVILVVEHLDCGAFGVVLNGARQQSDRIVGEGIVQRRFLEAPRPTLVVLWLVRSWPSIWMNP